MIVGLDLKMCEMLEIPLHLEDDCQIRHEDVWSGQNAIVPI